MTGNVCSGTLPDAVAGTPTTVNTTGPLTPAGAGPWMWAAVAEEVKPKKVRSTVIWSRVSFKRTLSNPVPPEAFGGTTLLPVRVASKSIVASAEDNHNMTSAATASAPVSIFMRAPPGRILSPIFSRVRRLLSNGISFD